MSRAEWLSKNLWRIWMTGTNVLLLHFYNFEKNCAEAVVLPCAEAVVLPNVTWPAVLHCRRTQSWMKKWNKVALCIFCWPWTARNSQKLKLRNTSNTGTWNENLKNTFNCRSVSCLTSTRKPTTSNISQSTSTPKRSETETYRKWMHHCRFFEIRTRTGPFVRVAFTKFRFVQRQYKEAVR